MSYYNPDPPKQELTEEQKSYLRWALAWGMLSLIAQGLTIYQLVVRNWWMAGFCWLISIVCFTVSRVNVERAKA